MLREISGPDFLDWIAYVELEPFGSQFDDVRTASLVQTMVNLTRDRKQYQQPFPLKRFLLMPQPDGEAAPTARPQTEEEKVINLKQMANVFRMIAEKNKTN